MKILFLVSHLKSGGAERTVSYLSKYMTRRGCDVSIVSISDDVFYDIDSGVQLITLGVTNKCKNKFGKLLNAAKRLILVNRAVKKYSPDVVFCIMCETAKYVVNAHKRKKFKLITSERANPAFISNKKTKELCMRMYEESDGIIFQTERARNWFPENIRQKGTVIHNAVGNELVFSVGDIAERKKKISAVGRLDSQKDYPTLLAAFKRVLEKYPDYTLEIFGSGSEEQGLRALSFELGIAENVYFMGVRKDAILKIADSACYVLSSIYEGMPNALMEAMAIGLPCVATDCPNGPAELIEDGKNGLLVPVGDDRAMAEAICRFIEDSELAQSCSKAAKDILESHTVEYIAQKYLDYVLSVVNK